MGKTLEELICESDFVLVDSNIIERNKPHTCDILRNIYAAKGFHELPVDVLKVSLQNSQNAIGLINLSNVYSIEPKRSEFECFLDGLNAVLTYLFGKKTHVKSSKKCFARRKGNKIRYFDQSEERETDEEDRKNLLESIYNNYRQVSKWLNGRIVPINILGFNEWYSLVEHLSDRLECKKKNFTASYKKKDGDTKISRTDEQLVAYGFARCFSQNTPVTIASNDRDIYELILAVASLMQHYASEYDNQTAKTIRQTPLRLIRPSQKSDCYILAIDTKNKIVQNPFLRSTGQRIGTDANGVLEIYNKAKGYVDAIAGNPINVTEFAISNRE